MKLKPERPENTSMFVSKLKESRFPFISFSGGSETSFRPPIVDLCVIQRVIPKIV